VAGLGALLALVTAFVPAGRPGSGGPVPGDRPTARPDIVLVLTDDQRYDTLLGMPQVQRLLVQQGTLFPNAMVPTARCCPSRTSILTGLYSNRSRVYDNQTEVDSRFGGWATFHRRGMEFRTIALGLQRAGYRTGLYGKYLNGFNESTPQDHRSPGWDEMQVFRGGAGAYFRYRLTDGSWYGAQPEDYSTDVLARQARQFIRSTADEQPLFLMYTPFAPHGPYIPAPRHAAADVPLPPPTIARDEGRSPAWRERRAASESRFAASVPTAQARTLLAVDEAVTGLVATLEATGRLDDTLLIFTSDNGYLWGEHGLVGKDTAYDKAIRVPLVLRWDGRLPVGRVDDRLALNVDIATTVARVAGLRMETDGLDLLAGNRRAGFVVEGATGRGSRPSYCGWRTRRHLYVRYGDGFTELYDYARDPDESRNLAGEPAVRTLENRLRDKAVRACRPVPPEFSW